MTPNRLRSAIGDNLTFVIGRCNQVTNRRYHVFINFFHWATWGGALRDGAALTKGTCLRGDNEAINAISLGHKRFGSEHLPKNNSAASNSWLSKQRITKLLRSKRSANVHWCPSHYPTKSTALRVLSNQSSSIPN